jgi:hypothetical protein
MDTLQDVHAPGTRLALRPTEEGWDVTDRRYRVRENPDPWTRPGEEPRSNYVVEVLMHNRFYYCQKEVPTLEAALLYIQEDSAQPVFTGGPDSMCRWCREYEYDLRHGHALRACNLCEPEVYPEEPLLEECPDCRQVGGCDKDACICPQCWTGRYPHRENVAEAMLAWESYKPMMRALNAENVEWLWGQQHRGTSPVEYNLEIEHAEKHAITITRRGTMWFSELYGEVTKATRWTPPEWDVVTGIASEDINEIVAWTCQAIANTTEGA